MIAMIVAIVVKFSCTCSMCKVGRDTLTTKSGLEAGFSFQPSIATTSNVLASLAAHCSKLFLRLASLKPNSKEVLWGLLCQRKLWHQHCRLQNLAGWSCEAQTLWICQRLCRSRPKRLIEPCTWFAQHVCCSAGTSPFRARLVQIWLCATCCFLPFHAPPMHNCWCGGQDRFCWHDCCH